MGSNALLTRLLVAPIVLVLTTLFMFALPAIQGVDQARTTLQGRSQEASPDEETLRQLEEELGLAKPAHERYFAYLGRLATGDFGESNVSRRPVAPQVARAGLTSATLVGTAMALAVTTAVVVGVTAASKPKSIFDRSVTATSRLLVSIPGHVLAPLVIYLFGVRFQWFPTGGWGEASQLVLPTVALAASPTALFSQIVRAETLDALAQPYITTAVAKGVPQWKVVWVHAARMSTTGVLTLGGMFSAGLFGGAVIIEVIFGIPGLGRLLHDAVRFSDVPMLQGGGLAAVAVGLSIGLLTDLGSSFLTPPPTES